MGDARDPASLVAAVLDEEARRQAEAAGPADAHPESLPGVGGDDVRLRSVLDSGRFALLVTVGGVFALGLAIFSVAAILAIKVAHHYDWSFRFLVQVAVLPGFTIILLSQPLGNLVDRSTTHRPRVFRVLLAVSVLALLLSGAAFYRWEFLGVLAFTGVGVLATVPVQCSLLADAFPVRARPRVFAAYVAIGAAGFVVGPLLVALTTSAFDGTAEWRAVFVALAVAAAALSVAAGRLVDVRRGRAEVREIFGDDLAIREEHLSTLHALTRFRQIATLRYGAIGVLAMGFGLVGWGLWFNLWLQGHFQVRATDRGLLLAVMAMAGVALTPVVGAVAGRAVPPSPAPRGAAVGPPPPRVQLRARGMVDAHGRDDDRVRCGCVRLRGGCRRVDPAGGAGRHPAADARAGFRGVHQLAVHRRLRRGRAARRLLARARTTAHRR